MHRLEVSWRITLDGAGMHVNAPIAFYTLKDLTQGILGTIPYVHHSFHHSLPHAETTSSRGFPLEGQTPSH